MADEKRAFFDNPFRGLDASGLPKRAAKKVTAPKKIAPPAEPDEDSELFLRAMSRRVVAPPQAKGGFALSEQCDPGRKRGPKKRKPAAAIIVPEAPEAPAEESDEEKNAFLLAARGSAPLSGKGRAVARKTEIPNPPSASEPSFGELLEASCNFDVRYTDEYMEGRVSGLDESTMNGLRMGRFSPEAHLDLHGLNVAQAFEALRDFIRDSWAKGLRSVLIVHGRGHNSPDGMGVLRRKLSLWLTQEPFKRVVLAFCTAQPHDGGPGGSYALLRKNRKKGPVFWEKLPADADLY